MAFKFNEYHLGSAGGGVIEPITIKQNGTYNATDGVDGYAPITVDVAGSGGGDNTVIDVESLPTENVDDSKIYRMTETLEPVADIYVYDYDKNVYIPVREYCINYWEMPNNTSFTYHVVDSLPETLIQSDDNICDYHVYIHLETGESWVYIDWGDGAEVMSFMYDWMRMSFNYCGVVHNVDDMTTPEGYYYFVSEGEVRTIYGIPDRENAKDTFEYTADGKWVERGGIVDVAKLPTQNISNAVAYRISSTSEMYVYNSWFGEVLTLEKVVAKPVELHIVDDLPEQMIPGSYNDESEVWHVYIVESTGIGYFSTTGDPNTDLRTLSGCMLFPEWLGMDMGRIDSLNEITRDGFYFVAGKDNLSMHTHSAEGWTDYINGETYNNILQERNTFSNDRAMLTAKYNATIGHITDEGALNFLNKIECEVNDGIVAVTGLTDKNITSIIIPTGVSYIKTTVFEDCASLTSLVLSEGLVEIYYGAFRRCTSLTSVVFPSTLEALANGVFEDCSAMQYYDFTALKHVPYILSNGTFWNIPATCQIRVADDLYEQWMERYGWWSYSNQIVKASESS